MSVIKILSKPIYVGGEGSEDFMIALTGDTSVLFLDMYDGRLLEWSQ